MQGQSRFVQYLTGFSLTEQLDMLLWLPWPLDQVGTNSLSQNRLHQAASLPGAKEQWQCHLAVLEGSAGCQFSGGSPD